MTLAEGPSRGKRYRMKCPGKKSRPIPAASTALPAAQDLTNKSANVDLLNSSSNPSKPVPASRTSENSIAPPAAQGLTTKSAEAAVPDKEPKPLQQSKWIYVCLGHSMWKPGYSLEALTKRCGGTRQSAYTTAVKPTSLPD